ncbi:hypothetical protein F2Q68_00041209 [Brassica cretica]|uniref:Uncharacterized protein n=1 Tax=Brassica cretica TaxID=69181 RepID=A0A8S9MP10_BRACR|nr:hypothetical protein F2Q68_00041209 [Brassica cretica]
MVGLKLHHARVIDVSLVFKYETIPQMPCLNALCRSMMVDEPNHCHQKAVCAMRLMLQVVDNRAYTSIPDPVVFDTKSQRLR